MCLPHLSFPLSHLGLCQSLSHHIQRYGRKSMSHPKQNIFQMDREHWKRRKLMSGGLDAMEKASVLPDGPANYTQACQWNYKALETIQNRAPDICVSVPFPNEFPSP